MKVLDKLDEGLSIASVRHQYDAKKSVNFFVKKMKTRSGETFKINVPLSTSISYLSCNPFLGRIERELCIWLEDIGAEFPDLEVADIQVVLDCLAAELP